MLESARPCFWQHDSASEQLGPVLSATFARIDRETCTSRRHQCGTCGHGQSPMQLQVPLLLRPLLSAHAARCGHISELGTCRTWSQQQRQQPLSAGSCCAQSAAVELRQNTRSPCAAGAPVVLETNGIRVEMGTAQKVSLSTVLAVAVSQAGVIRPAPGSTGSTPVFKRSVVCRKSHVRTHVRAPSSG